MRLTVTDPAGAPEVSSVDPADDYVFALAVDQRATRGLPGLNGGALLGHAR